MANPGADSVTWLDVNSWQFQLAGHCLLVDPWLVGDLVFGNTSWLIRGVRPNPVAVPAQVDLLLPSQGLADHAHPETLDILDKSIPVVASESGAKVATEKGFTNVTSLPPGQSYRLGDDVLIEALPGAPIGPLASVMTPLEDLTDRFRPFQDTKQHGVLVFVRSRIRAEKVLHRVLLGQLVFIVVIDQW